MMNRATMLVFAVALCRICACQTALAENCSIFPVARTFNAGMRTYSVRELHDLTARIGTSDYVWDIGTVKSKTTPIPITYLIGVPIDNAA